MAESTDIETAIETLENGTEAEQVDTLGTLSNLSHSQPDVFVPYLDVICSFADHEHRYIRSFTATILANVARHDPSAMVPHADVVSTLLADDDPKVLKFTTAAAMKVASVSPEKLLSETDRLFELLPYEDGQESETARNIRMRTVLALAYLGDANPKIAARFDEPLAERLDDAESQVRAVSVTAVARLGVAHPESISTALTHLPERLDDPDPETRRHAVGTYANFRHKQPDAIVNPESVAPAFKKAIDRVDFNEENAEKVSETHQYIRELAATQ